MGRKLFLSDLAAVSVNVIPNIEGVHLPEDGLVRCFYNPPKKTPADRPVSIDLVAGNIDEYPHANSFIIYATDDDLPQSLVPQTLSSATEHAHGKSLQTVLSDLSRRLDRALETGTDNEDENDTKHQDQGRKSGQDEEADELDFDFDETSSGDDFGLTDLVASYTDPATVDLVPCSRTAGLGPQSAKIRNDLKALKQAGFRVGVFGTFQQVGCLSVSIRVGKLGLSDDALQAWKLDRRFYLVLLIRYVAGYLDANQLSLPEAPVDNVATWVGLCDRYKPTTGEMHSLFLRMRTGCASSTSRLQPAKRDGQLQELFIDKPINTLLRERLFSVIMARRRYNLSWLGAEQMIDDAIKKGSIDRARDDCRLPPSPELDPDGKGPNMTHPSQPHDDSRDDGIISTVVRADHMETTAIEDASFPLIAMQFALRHVVRCPEFCLVCHRRVDSSFKALKPYVCDRELCLHQYMDLGFGPSLEWEIRSQPYVVDLLVSFCYAAAWTGGLKEFPLGLGLCVPQVGASSTSLQGTFDPECNKFVVLDDNCDRVKVKEGDWVLIPCLNNTLMVNCRIRGVNLPTLSLDPPVVVSHDGPGLADSTSTQSTPTERMKGLEAHKAVCYPYDQDFDQLTDANKQAAIIMQLNVLPSVEDMCRYLAGSIKHDHLRKWEERIPLPALTILRWIVASNRSCIMQVGKLDPTNPCSTWANLAATQEDHVAGFDGWIQFRFAQGAPDKEKRFDSCVREQAVMTGTAYPTFFAWHGSPLDNWHSIVRQGLRFDRIAHGRAYGHGVYMSPHATTGMTYTAGVAHDKVWKSSMLGPVHTVSLNEVVNNPAGFVNTTPHYVVSKLDWIQTRYLFVQVTGSVAFSHTPPTQIFQQDPQRLAYGNTAAAQPPLVIPLSAVSKARRLRQSVVPTKSRPGKRTKAITVTDEASAERRQDDANSVVSDADDRAWVEDDADARQDGPASPSVSSTTSPPADQRSTGDRERGGFQPGTLDLAEIQFLQPPENARPNATQALLRLLAETLKVQEVTGHAALGWYIDKHLIDNMYQWIVELHSFPDHLPLARDMKAAQVTSVVLEIRFSPDYPWSPPFVRVVKPRFLPFTWGGGGHVTEGGAICLEVLTNQGWSAAYSMEHLLLVVRMAMCEDERPARLASSKPAAAMGRRSYEIGEAVDAYIRACRAHNWPIPADINNFRTVVQKNA